MANEERIGVTCPACGRVNRPGAIVCGSCRQNLLVAVTQASGSKTGLAPSDRPLVDRYQIIQKLAQGGMSSVFKAFDLRLQRVVVVKEMQVRSTSSSEYEAAIASFRQEARLLARLSHPGLMNTLDYFNESGKEYLVSEYIEGKTLEGTGTWSEKDVLSVAFQLCDVLEYLHNQPRPIIYRDLKPANVMLDEKSGLIKLIDFGIARFYNPGKDQDTQALGTPGYAPPEQYGRAQTDLRSDVFSFGILLHVLLTAIDISQSPWNYPPVRRLNPNVSKRLEQIIEKATALKPENRYQSIVEMRNALLQCVGSRESPSKTAHAKTTITLPKDTSPSARLPRTLASKRDMFGWLNFINKVGSVHIEWRLLFLVISGGAALGLSVFVLKDRASALYFSQKITDWVVLNWPWIAVVFLMSILVYSKRQPLQIVFGKFANKIHRRRDFILLCSVLVSLTVALVYTQSGQQFVRFASSIILDVGVWAYPFRRWIVIGAVLVVVLANWKHIVAILRQFGTSQAGTKASSQSPKPTIQLPTWPSTISLKDPSFLSSERRKFVEDLQIDQIHDRISTFLYTGKSKYLMAGYGSFGGTTAVKEAIRRFHETTTRSTVLPIYFELVDSFRDDKNIAFRVTVDNTSLGELQTRNLGKIDSEFIFVAGKAIKKPRWLSSKNIFLRRQKQTTTNDALDFETFVEGLNQFSHREQSKNPFLQIIRESLQKSESPSRIVLIIDKIRHLEILEMLHQKGIFDNDSITSLVLARYEDVDRWDSVFQRLSAMRFEEWYVPCLWNHEGGYIHKLVDVLVDRHQIRSQKAESNFSALCAHLEFVARGALGNMIREIEHSQYWITTNEPYVLLENLPNISVIQRNQMKQNILAKFGHLILPRNDSLPEQSKDRERLGVYSLVDWIDPYNPTYPRINEDFSRDSLLQMAIRDKIVSASYSRIAEVVWNLIEVLRRTGYLDLNRETGLYRVSGTKNLILPEIRQIQSIPSEWYDLAKKLSQKKEGRVFSHYVEASLPFTAIAGQQVELEVAVKRNPNALDLHQDLDVDFSPSKPLELDINVSTSSTDRGEPNMMSIKVKIPHGTDTKTISTPIVLGSGDKDKVSLAVFQDTKYLGGMALDVDLTDPSEDSSPSSEQQAKLEVDLTNRSQQPDITISVLTQPDGNGRNHYVYLARTAGRETKGSILPSVSDPQKYFAAKFQHLNQTVLKDAELDSIGLELWDQLIPKNIQEFIWDALHRIDQRNTKPYMQIIADDVWIPWELLHTYDHRSRKQGDFLCLQANMTRWLREALEEAPTTISIQRFGLSIDRDLDQANKEAAKIRALFAGRARVIELELTYPAIINHFENGGHCALHFVCHGRHNPDNSNDSTILLSGNEEITPAIISGDQYLRQIRRIKRWVNRILESFSGEIPTIHTTYDRNHRTAYLF